MKKIYDFIIIGGGPAGSTAATNLARNGFEVLVLEKEKFPRFHVGESLLPFCYHIFEDLGVLEQVKKEFVEKPGATFSNIDNSTYSHWCFDKVIEGPSQVSYHVKRERFDQILLENSAKKGATVIEEAKVVQLDMELNKLVEIEALLKGTEQKKFFGKFIIDASGQDSFIGKKMGTKQRRSTIASRVAYYSHWSNVNFDTPLKNGTIRIVMLEGEKKGWIWMFYIGKQQMSIGLVLDARYVKKLKQNRSDDDKKGNWISDLYLSELNSSPFVKKIISGAKQDINVHVTSDYSYNVENKYGEKHALIGDSSAFLDPIFSSGVYLALKSAMLVSDALIEAREDNKVEILGKTYEDLKKGYQLVEKLITTFYDDDSVKFPEANPELATDYNKYESAFSVMHMILSGDFFQNSQKYFDSIAVLADKKSIDRFRHLTDHSEETILEYCK